MVILKDPHTQRAAVIDKEGNLNTKAIIQTWAGHHSGIHGSTFGVGNGDITLSGVEQHTFHFKNTSTTDLVYIVKAYASTNDTAGVKITFWKNCIYTSGGTAVTPVNLNFNKSISALASSFYGNAMVLGGTMVPIFSGYIAQGFRELHFDEAMILGPNDTISISVLGTNTKKATVGIIFFYHGGVY